MPPNDQQFKSHLRSKLSSRLKGVCVRQSPLPKSAGQPWQQAARFRQVKGCENGEPSPDRHSIRTPVSVRRPAPAPPEREHRLDSLGDSLDKLSQEVRLLREVIDEIREEFSWLTRNGLPTQPIEHVTVKRMSKDSCAEDWAERLVLEHNFVSIGRPRLDASCVREIVVRIECSFEAAATGQLGLILPVLESVKNRIIEEVGKATSPVQAKSPPPPGTMFTEPGDQRSLF
jgi:hypothetical protein